MMHSPIRRLLSLPLLLVLFVAPLWSGQTTAPSQVPRRATSTPYTGDLSVFDSPGRGRRLQINRVIDILGIASGNGCVPAKLSDFRKVRVSRSALLGRSSLTTIVRPARLAP